MATTHPIVLCLLLCDGIHLDPRSRERYLLGTLEEVQARMDSPTVSDVWVYAELASGHGTTPLAFHLVRLDPKSFDGR